MEERKGMESVSHLFIYLFIFSKIDPKGRSHPHLREQLKFLRKPTGLLKEPDDKIQGNQNILAMVFNKISQI